MTGYNLQRKTTTTDSQALQRERTREITHSLPFACCLQDARSASSSVEDLFIFLSPDSKWQETERLPTHTHTHTHTRARCKHARHARTHARARERERWLYTQKKKRRKKRKEKKRVGGWGGGGGGRQKKRPRTRSYYQDTKCICQDIPVEPQALPLGNLTLHTVVHTLSQPLTLSCTSSSSWQGRSPTHNAHLEVIHSLSLHPFNQSCTIYHQYITISTEGLGYAGDTDDTLTM